MSDAVPPPPARAKLRVVLMADNTVVAESDDFELWSNTLRAIHRPGPVYTLRGGEPPQLIRGANGPRGPEGV